VTDPATNGDIIEMPGGAELALLSVVPEAVFIEDANGTIVFWNDAAERLYGRPRNESIGQSADDLLGATPPIEGLSETRVSRRRADHTEISVRVRRSYLHAADGEVAATIDASRDLSERDQLDVEARYAEHRYLNMYNAVAVSFWELVLTDALEQFAPDRAEAATPSTDAEADVALLECVQIVHANDRTASFLGIDDADEIQGTEIGRFWPVDQAAALRRSIASVLSGNQAFTTETWLKGAGGRRIDVLFTLSRLPDTHGKPALLGGFVDVSDFKRAEQSAKEAESRYRAIFQTLAVALLEIDFREVYEYLGGLASLGVVDLVHHAAVAPNIVSDVLSRARVVDANETAVAAFGGESREQLLGDVARYWPDESRKVFLDAVNTGFLGNPRFEAETRLATFDGREIDVIFTAVTPRESVQTGSVVIGIVDITDSVAARAAVERLQADLAHAARVSVLGELTASIAHEINQPLAAITANGQAGLRWLARPQIDVEEVRTLTSRMVADAYRATDIIGRIRAMAAKRRPERAQTSLNTIVEEAATFLRHEIQSSSVALSMDLAAGLPPIEADRTQLQQVIVNLAMNAVQAMAAIEPERRQLSIRTSRSGTEALTVEIVDSGPGIAPENLGRLFDSFFTTKEEGLGIGLPICRSIVEAHGGTIEVTQNPNGKGARFMFSVEVTPCMDEAG
jgi:PAS domain S-box-containing protein